MMMEGYFERVLGCEGHEVVKRRDDLRDQRDRGEFDMQETGTQGNEHEL